MGQKMDPHGLRVGIIKDWDSKWYAGKNDYADYLVEDYKLRKSISKKMADAGRNKPNKNAPRMTFFFTGELCSLTPRGGVNIRISVRSAFDIWASSCF